MRIHALLALLLLSACVGDAPVPNAGVDGGADVGSSDVGTDVVADGAPDAPPPDPNWTLALTARTVLNAMVVEPVTGNIYVGGSVKGPAPELGIAGTTADSEDLLLMKIEGETGKILWAKTFGGTGAETFNALTLTGGAIVGTGTTFGSTLGFPGAATGATLTFPNSTVNPSFATQTFIARFDANSGAPSWAVTPDANEVAGTAHRSLCTAIAAGTQVYVSCNYLGTKFGPSSGFAPSVTSGILGQSAILAVNAVGTLTLQKAFFTTTGAATVTSLLDSGGIIYAAGSTGPDLIDKIANVTMNTAANTLLNGFVLKFAEGTSSAATGRMLAGGTSTNIVDARGLALVGNDLVVTGRYGGTPTFFALPPSKGSSDAFIASVPTTFGAVNFATSFGGNGEDWSYSIASDGQNLWVGGTYYSTDMTFGPTSLANAVASGHQGYLGKASNVGVPTLALPVVSTTGNASVTLVRTDDTHARVLALGTYSGSVSFDDGTTVQSTSDSAGFLIRRPH